MQEVQNVVVVGGCGHVGLPFGMVLADHGMQVCLLDLDEPKVAAVNNGPCLSWKKAPMLFYLNSLARRSVRPPTRSACEALMW